MLDKKEEKIEEETPQGVVLAKGLNIESWKPRTELGKRVKNGEIKDIGYILEHGLSILEPEIVDMLLPNLESEIISVGQSKGKFGGGKRSIWRQTQKKTKEGNKPKFTTLTIVGNRDGYLGIGFGKSKETMPAREKALRKAKLNLIKIPLGCGSWACGCEELHSIPFKVEGKCGSVRITLMPAPKGTNLKIERECQKLLNLAGIKDIYSKTRGKTKTKLNLFKACFNALKNLSKTRIIEKKVKKEK